MRASSTTLAIALLLGAAGTARADGTPRENVRQLRYDLRVDVPVTSVAAVLLVGSEILKGPLVPDKCRWCYRLADGKSDLNAFDASLRHAFLWKDPDRADTLSSLFAFGLVPLTGFGLTAIAAAHDHDIHGYPLDVLVITEATLLAASVNQIVKFAFVRERPFAHFRPRDDKTPAPIASPDEDDNLSFYSGHTSLAFAFATAAGMTATIRGYRLAPLVWAVGMAGATTVGYLRIAADKHYASDVLTAMVIGSLIGGGIPLLFHSASGSAAATTPGGQGPGAAAVHTPFALSGAW